MKVSVKWANALSYVAAYLGATPFALVGGFLLLKSKNEAVHQNLKKTLLLYLFMLGCNAVYNLLGHINQIVDLDLYTFLRVVSSLIQIGSIVLYAVFAIRAFRSGSDENALA